MNVKELSAKWIPIESAPCDGSVFLALTDGEASPAGEFVCAYKTEQGVFYWDAFTHSFELHPSHWRPLEDTEVNNINRLACLCNRW